MATPLPLPTPRQFLTSLFNNLALSPFPPGHPNPNQTTSNKTTTEDERDGRTGNQLKAISHQQKALLASMHVLFPPPMLLQALDLLDRGLIERVVVRGDDGNAEGGEVGRKGDGDLEEGGTEEKEDGKEKVEDVGKQRGDGGEEVRKDSGAEDADEEMLLNEVEVNQDDIPRSEIPQPDIPPRDQEGSSPPWPSAPDPHRDPIPDPDQTARSTPPAATKPRLKQGQRLKPKHKPPHIYQVRSSHAPKSRFSYSTTPGAGTGTGALYTVRLEAWSCSCVAFAFNCYPSNTPSSHSPWTHVLQSPAPDAFFHFLQTDHVPTTDRDQDRDAEPDWEFGGWSLDGGGNAQGRGDTVPVCKHLLACLLGERWGAVLGRYVKVRAVTRYEMAGLGGEG